MPINEYADDRQRLLALLEQSHDTAARDNGNISSTVARMAYAGSGSIAQSIAAAILTTGERHAPIEEAYYNLTKASDDYLMSLGIVEGFGNSFFKDKIDPAFQPTYDYLKKHHPALVNRILYIQKVAHIEHLFPNAAIITAACLVVCDLPPIYGMALFIKYRVSAWVDSCLE